MAKTLLFYFQSPAPACGTYQPYLRRSPRLHFPIFHHLRFHQYASKEKGSWLPISSNRDGAFPALETTGFTKPIADKWWHEPNEEEKRRMSKMAGGSVFRKDL
jgi:hypothetical protein